jgi:hypothetical protein
MTTTTRSQWYPIGDGAYALDDDSDTSLRAVQYAYRFDRDTYCWAVESRDEGLRRTVAQGFAYTAQDAREIAQGQIERMCRA